MIPIATPVISYRVIRGESVYSPLLLKLSIGVITNFNINTEAGARNKADFEFKVSKKKAHELSDILLGNEEVSKIEDYHSHNTRRLDVEGMKELLLKLRFIREDLGLQPRSKAKEIRSE